MVMGSLGEIIESGRTNEGTAFVNFTVETQERNKKTNQDEFELHVISAYAGYAEALIKGFKKNKNIFIEAKNHYRNGGRVTVKLTGFTWANSTNQDVA